MFNTYFIKRANGGTIRTTGLHHFKGFFLGKKQSYRISFVTISVFPID